AATLADYLFAIVGQCERSFAGRHFGEETVVTGWKFGRGGGLLTGSIGSQRRLAPFGHSLTPHRRGGEKALLIFGGHLAARWRRGLVPSLQMRPAFSPRLQIRRPLLDNNRIEVALTGRMRGYCAVLIHVS